MSSAVAGVALARSSDYAVRLGGPVFTKSDDPGELAREHKRLGYSAAYCPKATVEDGERVTSHRKGICGGERRDFRGRRMGRTCWIPISKSVVKIWSTSRRRLVLAEAVGALCCVDIAGSYHPTVWYGPHPKNLSKEFFDATVENCRKVIDAVKPKRTKFTIEMMGWIVPNGPDAYLRLIKAVDRPSFAVHMDPCNAVNSPERFYDNGPFISECFQKLGRWIMSCHAKDLEWKPELNVHFVEVIPGRGSVDYSSI